MNFATNNLRNKLTASIFLFFLCGISSVLYAQTDKRIENIKKIYSETNEKIAESNENGEYSSVYLTEMNVNKNNGSYPAVGIFQSVVKFYFTYGNREKNPYPNRLLKIEIETKRSSSVEKYEYLFNENEQLIFYFKSEIRDEEKAEKRVYLQNETIFKSLMNEKEVQNKEFAVIMKEVLTEKRKLVSIFKNSLDY